MLRFKLDTDAAVQELVGSALPPLVFVHTYEVLSLLFAWLIVEPEARAVLIDPERLAGLEEMILLAAYDTAIRDPLAVIVSRLCEPCATDAKLAWACLCAAEWARAQGFVGVMLVFAHCAAAASDSIAYYLVAELATVSVELSRIPAGSEPAHARDLYARWKQLAEMVAEESCFVSLTGADLSEGFKHALPESGRCLQ
ncbi:MAG TPA: hypothetical protein VF092_21510 [Longimicrobium sp.]